LLREIAGDLEDAVVSTYSKKKLGFRQALAAGSSNRIEAMELENFCGQRKKNNNKLHKERLNVAARETL
jgi:hypothetical protein